jgi:hypothetical protein
MKYYNYIDVPNWKNLQQQLIDHKNKNLFRTIDDLEKDVNKKWHCYFPNQIKEELPEVFDTFKSMNLNIRQMIYFTNTQNELLMTDNMNKKCMFIHTDREDALDAKYETNIPLLTNFSPGNALNIPLENCEESLTLFYKAFDQNKNVFYPWYNCGGHAHSEVKEIDRFELCKPAILRINVPHAVHNPHIEPRVVATFRFYENLEEYLID